MGTPTAEINSAYGKYSGSVRAISLQQNCTRVIFLKKPPCMENGGQSRTTTEKTGIGGGQRNRCPPPIRFLGFFAMVLSQ